MSSRAPWITAFRFGFPPLRGLLPKRCRPAVQGPKITGSGSDLHGRPNDGIVHVEVRIRIATWQGTAGKRASDHDQRDQGYFQREVLF